LLYGETLSEVFRFGRVLDCSLWSVDPEAADRGSGMEIVLREWIKRT